jgi:hypothetical protein
MTQSNIYAELYRGMLTNHEGVKTMRESINAVDREARELKLSIKRICDGQLLDIPILRELIEMERKLDHILEVIRDEVHSEQRPDL